MQYYFIIIQYFEDIMINIKLKQWMKIALGVAVATLAFFLFVVYGQGGKIFGGSMGQININDGEVEVLATMDEVPSKPNRVWVGTFQLVWNKLMDEYTHGPVVLKDYNSSLIEALNRRNFDANDIAANAYYATFGNNSFAKKAEIEKAIREKFDEESDILHQMEWSGDGRQFIIYAMLKKEFKFLEKFSDLGKKTFGKNKIKTAFFGIDEDSDENLDDTVNVLFYGENDYAVELPTRGDDVVLLYRTDVDKPFDALFAEMMDKKEKYARGSDFDEIDELRVPNFDFYLKHYFDELSGKTIVGGERDVIIQQALETIEFKMDREGVKLKSEAAIYMGDGFMPVKTPRYFYFDDTFVLFLMERGRQRPYFAMRVQDMEPFL